MTQDNDNNGSSRLDRIESLLLQLAESSVRHDNEFSRWEQRMDRAAERMDRIEATVDGNAQAIAQMQQSHDQLIHESLEWFGQVFTRIDEMQSEVKGLQTENRRILERLEQHMSNGH
jgi:phage shock protein A